MFLQELKVGIKFTAHAIAFRYLYIGHNCIWPLYLLRFFLIQFWYLRCCGCPWNRGRQHLATPLKTCHNTEAGFLQGGCSAYPPTQRWRHLRLRRSRTWAVCLPLSPQKGDHPPSHDDNFARTSVCRWLPQKPTVSQKTHGNYDKYGRQS